MRPEGQPKAHSRQARSEEADNAPADLVGRKVSILYRLDDDPAFPFSEVVGVVQRVKGATLLIRKRDGKSVEVSQSNILKLKVIPT